MIYCLGKLVLPKSLALLELEMTLRMQGKLQMQLRYKLE